MAVLRVLAASILFISQGEGLLAVRDFAFATIVQSPVLVDDELQVESGLLAHVALEVFVHLITHQNTCQLLH